MDEDAFGALDDDAKAQCYRDAIAKVPPTTAEDEVALLERAAGGDRDAQQRLQQAHLRLVEALGRQPTMDERAAATGVPVERSNEVLAPPEVTRCNLEPRWGQPAGRTGGAMDDAAVILREIEAVPPLTPEEEAALVQRLQAGDLDAERWLFDGAVHVVLAVAREYAGAGLSLLALLEEGGAALVEAIESFELCLGVRIADYAEPAVRVAITGAVVRAARCRFRQESGREPTELELAGAVGLPAGWLDLIDLRSGGPVGVVAGALDLRHAVEAVLTVLDDTERKVFLLRLGLVDGGPQTVAEVAENCGMSPRQVRETFARALKKVRQGGRK